MRTTVTGGAGFIGSHLTEYLLARGDDVIVLDNLSTGRISNLDAVIEHPRLTVQEGSILDQVAVRQAIGGADRVFHLAAAVGVHLIVDRPLDSLRTNIHGAEMVLAATLDAGARLLLVSTSEIYGKNTADRLTEDADLILGSPLKARWSYAAAKGIDEAFAHAYWRDFGLPVTIVRLFNTVGPRQRGRYGMVVPNLLRQALSGQPLTVHGDGRQTRCFSHVADIVPSLVALAETDQSLGEAFNLGGGFEVSIMDLAHRIIALTGSASPVRLVPYEQAYGPGYEDMRRRVPDNGKAATLVGFDPRTTLDQIIESMIDGQRAELAAAYRTIDPALVG